MFLPPLPASCNASLAWPARRAGASQGGRGAPLVDVHLGLLAADVGEAAADTPDGGQREHDLLLAVDVGVQHTQNVLKLIGGDQGLRRGGRGGGLKGSTHSEQRACYWDAHRRDSEVQGSRAPSAPMLLLGRFRPM